MALWRATVNLSFPIGSQGGTNTWHMRSTGIEPADTDIQDLLDAIQAFYDALSNDFPSGFHAIFDGFVTQVGVEDPDSLGGFTPWNVAGDAATTAWGPSPAMACITWRSTKASRRGRGRTFVGPVRADDFQSDGTLDTDFRSRLLEAASDLIDSSEATSNGAIGVYSTIDHQLRDYVAATVTDQVAILRSRRG